MKGIMKRVLETIVATIMIGCVLFGIILMMCEAADFHSQLVTMATGLVFICIGIVPGAVVSLIATRKDERKNGRIYE